MNLINLLKNYKGSLYSLVHGEIKFNHIKDDKIICCDYEAPIYGTVHITFDADGRWIQGVGECILFPSKEQRQWNNFFKDGDIVASDDFPGCVYVYNSNPCRDYYYGVTSRGNFYPSNKCPGSMCEKLGLRLANQDEINRLHDAVIKAGYFAIDAINLVKAQFEEGDYIRHSGSCGVYYQVLHRTIKEYVIKDAYSGEISTIIGDKQREFTKTSSREGMICVSQFGVIYLCKSNHKHHLNYNTAHCHYKGGRFYISDTLNNFCYSRLANVKEVAQFIHIMKLHHCDFIDNKLTFVPLSKGEQVLFRNSDTEPWIKGVIIETNANKFTCVDSQLKVSNYTQCIPYNTVTQDFAGCQSKIAPEFYKTW